MSIYDLVLRGLVVPYQTWRRYLHGAVRCPCQDPVVWGHAPWCGGEEH